MILTPPGISVGALTLWSVGMPAFVALQEGGPGLVIERIGVSLFEVTLRHIPFGIWFLVVLFLWGSGASKLARTAEEKVSTATRAGYILMAYTPCAVLIYGIMRGVIRIG